MSDVVARAKAALEGAYEGPWINVGGGNIHVDPVGSRPPTAKTWTRANGDFIAAARSLIPELVAEVEARERVIDANEKLMREVERLREAVEEVPIRTPHPDTRIDDAPDAVAAFDVFLQTWVPSRWHGHLLDNDENDAERVRDAIRAGTDQETPND